MNDRNAVDYIIVGQGLAGSAVAMQLLKHGKKIAVVDTPDRNISSRVAAGLFNPITGRNPVKTWLADKLFPYLHAFYPAAEKITGRRFFYPMPLYRPFASTGEQNEWMGKSVEPAYAEYIHKVHAARLFGANVNDIFGGLELKQCGYLDTSVYLMAVRDYIRSKGHVLDLHFDEEEVQFTREAVNYREFRAQRIIVCQGSQNAESKWFSGLPVHALKGEMLRIKSDWNKDVILNRGVYMVRGNVPGEYRVGATYNFRDLSAQPTEEGRQELEQKLQALISIPYTVVEQEWGVRPTTPDRRPVLGRHPEFERLIIFNGLGTKGVSLAPYFSEVLFRWLENASPLDKDVALTRYK